MADGLKRTTTSRPLRARRWGAAFGLAAALMSGAPTAWAQSYLPVGPQKNVPVATVTGGGWVECYRDTYNKGNDGAAWQAAQAGCAGARLMLACRPTGSSTIQLLAQAPRADVLTDTGTDLTTTHTANGTAWYWNNNLSWGFAAQGDSVAKNECDVAGSGDNDARLCWHSVNNAGGYRCGADMGLNSSTTFERIIYAPPPSSADLAITKTDGVTTATAGGSLTYTISASNAGPDSVTGATVTDTLPAALSGATWTCVGAGGGTCAASGSGNLSQAVNLPVGGSVTFTVSATVSVAATGTLSNTATITAPTGVSDPNVVNNSETDTDTITQGGELAVTLTGTAGPVTIGAPVTYTLVASNTGPSTATGAGVTGAMAAQLQGLAWTCVGSAGGVCAASGANNLIDIATLPAGASVTYTITGTVAPTATPGTISSTATLTPPAGFNDPLTANNRATAFTAIAAPAIPTLSAWALALVAALMASGAALSLRRSARGRG
ncbi:DUF11 domain-containing protein [Ottowia oryzae]|uniref:DUF11 domain-containing protein n=1 Tax=Ottowia oryzae TaxID=2109914 RepID=A0A2S0MDR7_9BURK|nr:DUF11 domain-containing protein [Ottowia oryzae]AVO33970.1 hypothetical protein C6570_06690 [Ottowia oryzae]